MENLQIYGRALLETGQGEAALSLYGNSYAASVLSENGADAVTVWEILFEAAAMTDDLSFFNEHFSDYEKLKKQNDPVGNCIEIRRLLAELYARRGMNEEKEKCKQELLAELDKDESLKKSELFYQTYHEKILSI